jgi:hypothetical protein
VLADEPTWKGEFGVIRLDLSGAAPVVERFENRSAEKDRKQHERYRQGGGHSPEHLG